MLQFRLFGIPVTIQPFHWAILGLFGFMRINPQGQSGLLLVALFMFAGFLSILVHELGHALTGQAFGARPEVVLHGFGGVAIFPGAHFGRWQSFLVTLAGPGVQLLLAWLAWALLQSGQLPNTLIRNFFYDLYLVSLFWALFNLVPVWPLDGGLLMGSLLGEQRALLMHKISIGVALIIGLLLLSWGSLFGTVFMGLFAWQNYQMLQSNHPGRWQ